jgi:hypothetical protein
MDKLSELNIAKAFEDWKTQCIEADVLPIILIGMPLDGEGKDLKIWRGGDYTPYQIRMLLWTVIKNLPDQMENEPIK